MRTIEILRSHLNSSKLILMKNMYFIVPPKNPIAEIDLYEKTCPFDTPTDNLSDFYNFSIFKNKEIEDYVSSNLPKNPDPSDIHFYPINMRKSKNEYYSIFLMKFNDLSMKPNLIVGIDEKHRPISKPINPLDEPTDEIKRMGFLSYANVMKEQDVLLLILTSKKLNKFDIKISDCPINIDYDGKSIGLLEITSNHYQKKIILDKCIIGHIKLSKDAASILKISNCIIGTMQILEKSILRAEIINTTIIFLECPNSNSESPIIETFVADKLQMPIHRNTFRNGLSFLNDQIRVEKNHQNVKNLIFHLKSLENQRTESILH